MKKLSLCVFVVLFAALFVGVSNAQTMRQLMVIDIPFDFFVGDKALPAGHYSVLGGANYPYVWVRGEQKDSIAISWTSPNSTAKISQSNSLTFHRIGDTYFLAKVTLVGKDTYQTLPKTAREKELETLAANRAVTLVAGAAAAK